jgi:hypothetical protein
VRIYEVLSGRVNEADVDSEQLQTPQQQSPQSGGFWDSVGNIALAGMGPGAIAGRYLANRFSKPIADAGQGVGNFVRSNTGNLALAGMGPGAIAGEYIGTKVGQAVRPSAPVSQTTQGASQTVPPVSGPILVPGGALRKSRP